MRHIKLAALFAATLSFATLASAAELDDAQIAAIVVTANQVDIDAAKLALEVSRDAEVREFARRMVTDHTAANKAAANLAERLGLTPQSNETSEALAKQGQETLARLKGLEGAAFDAAYAEHEVAYHEQVIAALDGTLIPA